MVDGIKQKTRAPLLYLKNKEGMDGETEKKKKRSEEKKRCTEAWMMER